MDKARILDLLRKTADPDAKVRDPAEQQLNAIHKIIGFCPTLLECVLHPDLEVHIKQAAVIYLKNNILKFWDTRHLTVTENGHTDPSQFIIHEHDKKIITDSIVDAIVNCRNELISVHLSSIVNMIIKSDFPHKWPEVVEKIHYYLAQTNDPNAWSGALVTFHQLAKIYEYRNQNDRKPFLEALAILLPAAGQRLTQLLQSDPLSEQSCKLQKQILKTFHATLQYSLPLAILSRESFTQWMALITEIAKRDVPDMAQKDVDKEDRPDLIWWKCKKWSLHLLARIFERYGSPNSVQKEYKDFASWYINTFSYAVIQTIIKILEQYALGQYVSPRVMQQALNYLNTAVLHSMTWKMLKNDMMTVVEKIIFPLMCHSDEDEEMWAADPCEYIRMKFDIFEEYVSPVSASQNLLHSLCKKRRDMLQKTMAFVVDVLNKPQPEPRAKDGVLHMVGSIADVLNKKPLYQDQMEQLLAVYVFPQFSCPQGFLRARACWTLNHFANIEFKNPANIIAATQAVLHCITADCDLPVKVEASLCLQSLLHSQPASREVVRPHVAVLTHELVNLIRLTENEDVMEVLQKIVYLFPDDLVPIAVDLTNHLAETFHALVDSGETEEDEKISAAMAILSTIDTVLTMMDEQKEVIARLEPIVVNIILKIFERNTQELYEEATTLLSTITADAVSNESWRVFQTLYVVFKRDGMDYFTDMMSPIHNYVTVDPDRFIASEQNVIALFDMCQTIMNDPNGTEEMESYAAKLIEIIILQFHKKINANLLYSFIELAITRLRREIGVTEYRTLLLQIVIAVLWVDYYHLKGFFEKWESQNGQPPNTLFNSFIEQWLKDVNELQGIHDRKMSVIGFCMILRIPKNDRPPIVHNVKTQIVGSILTLCERLKVAYKKKATANSDDETDSSDEDEEASDNEAEVLEDDQDHVANEDLDDEFEDIAEDGEGLSDDSDLEDLLSDDDCEPTALESFETSIDMIKKADKFVDEFVLLCQTLEHLFTTDREWYTEIWESLSKTQKKDLCDLKKVSVGSLLSPEADSAAVVN